MSLGKGNKTFQKLSKAEKSQNMNSKRLGESCYGSNVPGPMSSSSTLKLSKKSFKRSICHRDKLTQIGLEHSLQRQKGATEGRPDQTSQSLSTYHKLSSKQDAGSLKMKRALKEKTQMNLKSEKNIMNNKSSCQKYKEKVASTSRALLKAPSDNLQKSSVRRKSRKALNKENIHPKTKLRETNCNRSSLARAEKPRLLHKRSAVALKKTSRKKISKLKKTSRKNLPSTSHEGVLPTFEAIGASQEFQYQEISTCNPKPWENLKTRKDVYKKISNILKKNKLELPKPVSKDVSENIWRYCTDAEIYEQTEAISSRLLTKRCSNKACITAPEKKVLKEIDELYSVVLGLNYISGEDALKATGVMESQEEIQTSRFMQTDKNNLLTEEFSRKKQRKSKQFEPSKERSVVQVINKLKKIKKKYKKSKEIVAAVNRLHKIIKGGLKFTRSTSIPRLTKTSDLFNPNALYKKNEDKDTDSYMPNPDTFRKLDTDRGYESQGINSLLMSNTLAKTDSRQNSCGRKHEDQLKLPLHLLHPLQSQMSHNSAAISKRGKINKKASLLDLNSNRMGSHQSSNLTAEFTEVNNTKNDEFNRRKEIRYNRLVRISSGSQPKKKDNDAIEILNYYNQSLNSEHDEQNPYENKMLKDVLYATIKLVLAQNKQIKKLKKVVTKSRDSRCHNYSLSNANDESRATDLSFLSIGKDAINPIITVKNFCRDACFHKNFQKADKNSKSGSENSEKESIHDLSHISENNTDSIDETLLQELGKKILKESIRSKSESRTSSKVEPRSNGRYCADTDENNGYSLITNANLLNTSMSPVHKAIPNLGDAPGGLRKEVKTLFDHQTESETKHAQKQENPSDNFQNYSKQTSLGSIDNSQFSLKYCPNFEEDSEFKNFKNSRIFEDSELKEKTEQNETSLGLQPYEPQEEKPERYFLQQEEDDHEPSSEHFQVVDDYSTSQNKEFKKDIKNYPKSKEENSNFETENFEANSVLLDDTSFKSQNPSQLDHRSVDQRGRYDSEGDNPYDESRSELFNPMTYTLD
ncbi:unnamed protein product [Moneuplotes crassus]|uniref:Uncharacterized protein n=1 Tax=Euplotes crassus TaxID=5936 RepID=A0AAD1UH43_EUPCR|nr:unnamed protein product [Moneuplotes crassus]